MSGRVKVQVVEARGQAAVVEWEDGGCLRRAVVPRAAVAGGACDSETLARGIPFGDDFAASLAGVEMPDAGAVECAMHRLGLWDGEDLRRNPKLLRLAIEKAFAPATAALVRGTGRKAREKARRAANRD